MAMQGKMAKGVAGLMLAASLMALVPTEASAAWRGGWHGGPRGAWAGGYHRGWRGPGLAAGVIGGLALGALAAGAYGPYYYGPGYYAAPAYDGDCYLTRQRVWNGYRYVIHRVEVCN